MPYISSFGIIGPEPKIFLCIPASAAAVRPNRIKTRFANVLITFFIIGKPVFNNRPRRQPRNPPDWIFLGNWGFDSLMSVDKLFASLTKVCSLPIS